jgi:hypothetical protein
MRLMGRPREMPLPYPTPLAAASRPFAGRRLALAIALASLLAFWLPFHLTLPLGRDQAIIGRVAATMLDGGWPYVDAWDHKGPATYLLYLPAYLLFGRGEHAIAWVDLLVLLGFAMLCERVGRGLGRRGAGAFAALALVLGVRNDYWTFGQPDAWIGVLFVGVAALLIDPGLSRRGWAMLAAGMAIGFATMVKPVYATMILLPLVACRLQPAGTPRLRLAATALAGFGATIGAFVAAFAAGGHLDALWQTYIVFNLDSHATRTWDDMQRVVLAFVVTLVAPRFDFGATVVLGAGVAGFVSLRRQAPRAAGLLGLGWLLALAAVAAQGKGFPYHFTAIHGVTALLAGLATARFVDTLGGTVAPGHDRREGRRRAILAGALLGLVACAMQPHAARARDWWMTQLGVMSEGERQQRLCEVDYCPWRLRALGAVIRGETAPGEPIFVWGFDSAIYVHADRPAASRFGFNYPLVGGTPEWRARVRAELMAALDSAPPRVIVVQEDDFIGLMHRRPSVDHLLDFPALNAFLATRYAPVHDLGRYVVHRRRE